MRSPKESALETKIIGLITDLKLSGKILQTIELALADQEIQALQDYANTVAIKRLGYNDHGPVHMRTVALNALIMMQLLNSAGVRCNLEQEEWGTFEDSLVAVFLAAFLHDIGMSISRQDHELYSAYLAYPLINRILGQVYRGVFQKYIAVQSLALEGISGHMGNRLIHSLEAGIILIADGCDMTKGRARIPMVIATSPKVGDIHRYSANAIESVRLSRGEQKAIRIEIAMSSEVGLFQVEAVLLGKIAASPAKELLELYATVQGAEAKQYL
ncbi:MAG: phosphohydrolase [Spirochaetaceae bacterium]|jgi:metal-dependent HD superfamily phosphatase/phosphodiesterase|nr:phosphohydrolase [Spirochaetaceae bacterium]